MNDYVWLRKMDFVDDMDCVDPVDRIDGAPNAGVASLSPDVV